MFIRSHQVVGGSSSAQPAVPCAEAVAETEAEAEAVAETESEAETEAEALPLALWKQSNTNVKRSRPT